MDESSSPRDEESPGEQSSPEPSSTKPSSTRPPSFWRVVLAPWVLMLRPGKAGICLAAGSRAAFCVSFGLATLCLAAVLVGLCSWRATVESSWTQNGNYEIATRSFAEVWRDWHRRGWFGPVEVTVLLVAGLPPLAAAGVSFLFLPTVHHGGSVWRSFRRAFCGVASGAGLLILETLFFGVAMVGPANLETMGKAYFDIYWLLVSIGVMAGVCLLLAWLGRAASALGLAEGRITLPPRCEGRGYDLTHRSTSGRCSECGLDVESSLTPNLRRPGCQWEEKGSEDAALWWLRTSWSAVTAPGRFYGSLKLRSPERSSRWFALWHYGAIGLAAAVWAFIVFAVADGPGDAAAACFVPFAAMFLVPLIGWGMHRLVGAAAASCWVVCGTLPDARWARKVIAYEAAYLWVFCLYSGALILSFAIWGDWVSQVLWLVEPGLWPLGMPPEIAALLLGNGGLCVLWLLRYRLAGRAIRWSNF